MKKKTPSSVKLSYCVLKSLDSCEKEIKNKPIPPLRIPEMKYIYILYDKFNFLAKEMYQNEWYNTTTFPALHFTFE